MPKISPKIHFYDKEKLEKINPETLKLWNKYKIDMSLRELSDRTVSGYENDTREPSQEALTALANYFDVTTDYLLGLNQTPKWANKKDANDLAKFLKENAGSMTYQGENLTEDEKEKLEIAMTQIFWKRHKHD